MAGEDLPESVLLFLDTCIDSVEQLRVLLLLQSAPERIWTTAEITTELRSADTSIANRLDALYARKVLWPVPNAKDRHKYSPTNEDLRHVIGELATQNQLRPYRVIEAIYSRPNKALQAFADAFKLRGGKS
ncbi:hypothetical protein K2X30_10240 [bacterium]|nr:hypothetical protein [bacterium]